MTSLRIGKHRIVKNIASLRKVNIAHPYSYSPHWPHCLNSSFEFILVSGFRFEILTPSLAFLLCGLTNTPVLTMLKCSKSGIPIRPPCFSKMCFHKGLSAAFLFASATCSSPLQNIFFPDSPAYSEEIVCAQILQMIFNNKHWTLNIIQTLNGQWKTLSIEGSQIWHKNENIEAYMQAGRAWSRGCLNGDWNSTRSWMSNGLGLDNNSTSIRQYQHWYCNTGTSI